MHRSCLVQDITVVGVDSAGKPRYFQHPAVQSACMFLGESLCLIPYFYLRWRRQKRKRLDPAYVPRPHHEKRSRRIQRIMAFAVPTLADACGTTLMNVGLFFTYASTYQMLRGTLVLFAGMFTVIILRRQLHSHHWFGMVLITAGAAIVGASSVIYPPPSSHNGSLGGVGPAAGVDAHAAEGLAALARHLLLHPQQQQQLLLLGDASILGSSGGLLSKVKEGAAAAAPLFGDVLVVLAQMFTALQFIMEEKYLVKYKVRVRAAPPDALGMGESSYPFCTPHGATRLCGPEPLLTQLVLPCPCLACPQAAALWAAKGAVDLLSHTPFTADTASCFLAPCAQVPTLLAVGLEGCWGLALSLLVLPVTTLVRGPDGQPLDDAVAALQQIFSIRALTVSVGTSVLSIAFFNFFGVSGEGLAAAEVAWVGDEYTHVLQESETQLSHVRMCAGPCAVMSSLPIAMSAELQPAGLTLPHRRRYRPHLLLRSTLA
jgi:drug/metabolite transporter (DMT)-like permease